MTASIVRMQDGALHLFYERRWHSGRKNDLICDYIPLKSNELPQARAEAESWIILHWDDPLPDPGDYVPEVIKIVSGRAVLIQ